MKNFTRTREIIIQREYFLIDNKTLHKLRNHYKLNTQQTYIITIIQGKEHATTVSLTGYSCARVLDHKATTQLQTVKKML